MGPCFCTLLTLFSFGSLCVCYNFSSMLCIIIYTQICLVTNLNFCDFVLELENLNYECFITLAVRRKSAVCAESM